MIESLLRYILETGVYRIDSRLGPFADNFAIGVGTYCLWCHMNSKLIT